MHMTWFKLVLNGLMVQEIDDDKCINSGFRFMTSIETNDYINLGAKNKPGAVDRMSCMAMN